MNQFSVESFQGTIDSYIQEFEKKSFGYRLPTVNYLGSVSTSERPFSSVFSVSFPVKNREDDVTAVLDNLIVLLKEPTEIFICFDNCEDQSEQVVKTWLLTIKKHNNSKLAIHLLRSDKDLFESTCENIIFRLSAGKYLVSTQADIYFEDATFLSRSREAFEMYSDLFAISGRAVVNESRTGSSRYRNFCNLLSQIRFTSFTGAQKILHLGAYFPGLRVYGNLSARPKSRMSFTSKQLRTLFIGPTVLRGPIVWRAEIFLQLGGFRDDCFYLGRDEMDLCQRAYEELGLYVGYLPSYSYSFLWQGTSHRQRSWVAQAEMDNRGKLASQLCPEYFIASEKFIYPKDYQRFF